MQSNEELLLANAAIQKVLDAGAEAKLRTIAGVRHVSVGLKSKGGRLLTDTLCIRVYVAQKKSPDRLAAADQIPAEVEGIATDVNTVAEFTFQADNARYRPVRGGTEIGNGIAVPVASTTIAGASGGQALPQGTIQVASTAGFPDEGQFTVTTTGAGAGGGVRTLSYTGKDATHFNLCSGGNGALGAAGAAVVGSPVTTRGTLGCIAIDDTNKAAVLLSNWHVLEGSTGSQGDMILQPVPERLPLVLPGQTSVRPSDDADKIAVLKRSAITAKVDAAIATIDVSSCCHCCGVSYSNEIQGLSVGGRPPRSTIVGSEPAVAGMSVFKVGASTLRTEGVVVDANYPSFSIQYAGIGYIFTGQIAIQNVDHAKQFSDVGDSGAVVVNMSNNIVGLVFAAGKDVAAGGGPQPFITLANHISDVFAALNIHIKYSPDIVVTAGQTLTGLPLDMDETTIPEPYRLLRERLKRHERTALIVALGERHRDEVMQLVNHCRAVTVAWHRCHGPAFLARLMGAVRDGHYRVPAAIKAITLPEALERMRAVLIEHGSAELKESMSRPEASALIEAFRGCKNLNEAIDHLATGRKAVEWSVVP